MGEEWNKFAYSYYRIWRRKLQATPVFLPEESQGRGAWWATVSGVAQRRTRLKRRSSSSTIEYKNQQYIGIIYWYMQQLGWRYRKICWEKCPISKVHTLLSILYEILEITWRLRKGWGGDGAVGKRGKRERTVAVKAKHEESVSWLSISTSWKLYCTIVLWK